MSSIKNELNPTSTIQTYHLAVKTSSYQQHVQQQIIFICYPLLMGPYDVVAHGSLNKVVVSNCIEVSANFKSNG